MAETKKKKVHIRTWYDLGDYNDNEKDFPPSIVDTYGYESLSDMVARIRRGEVIPPQPCDEFDYGDEDVDAAFDRAEPIENDLTDLDDARELIEARKAQAEADKALMKQRHEEMLKYDQECRAKRQESKDQPKVESDASQELTPEQKEQKKKGWFS